MKNLSYKEKVSRSPEDTCEIWKDYFGDLFSKKEKPYFDKNHYETVSTKVTQIKNSNGGRSIEILLKYKNK